jgi:hypothetical protein
MENYIDVIIGQHKSTLKNEHTFGYFEMCTYSMVRDEIQNSPLRYMYLLSVTDYPVTTVPYFSNYFPNLSDTHVNAISSMQSVHDVTCGLLPITVSFSSGPCLVRSERLPDTSVYCSVSPVPL